MDENGSGGGAELSAVLGSDVAHDTTGWWVDLTVGFEGDDGAEVVRRRVGPYLTEQKAQVAAHFIARAAGREGPPPTGF